MKFLVHILVMLSIVTAGISPACAFIGGKMSEIEICKSDGSVETIRVSDNQIPSSDQAPHKAQKECGFCTLTSQGKALGAVKPALIKALVVSDAPAFSFNHIVFVSVRTPFEATGPPSALV
jgi:hypothetical protein